MKLIIRNTTLRLGIAMLAASIVVRDVTAQAQVGTPVPHSIDHQGRLVTAPTYTTTTTAKGYFKFAIVNSAGTIVYWKNDSNLAPLPTTGQPIVEPVNGFSLPVTAGNYGLFLGGPGTLGIPYEVFTHPDLRVRTWFSTTNAPGSFLVQSPDVPIPAAAYAMQVPDGSITGPKIAPKAVDTAQLADGAVKKGKLFTDAVSTDNIAGNSITAGKLLAAGAAAPGQVLGLNATGLVWTAPGKGDGIWALNGTDAYYNGGKVGLGTSLPAHRLSVSGGPTWTQNGWLGSMAFDNGSAIGWKPNGMNWAFGLGHTNSGFCVFRSKSAPGDMVNGAIYDLFISDAGAVGINTISPAEGYNLHVKGKTLVSPGLGDIEFGSPSGACGISIARGARLPVAPYVTLPNRADVRFDGGILSVVAGSGSGAVPSTNGIAIDTAGNVGMGTAAPKARLDVIGTTRTGKLTITGGADIAEPFQMKEEELAKGSVVVIDDEHPGRLRRSTRAYDSRVAGIISGANGINAGIALHQEGMIEGGQNVALSGRVYVQADASAGPIAPGDLLTTSDTPGHAMKVAEHGKAQGAVIGKAMSSLNEGTGMVLVLVTLQ